MRLHDSHSETLVQDLEHFLGNELIPYLIDPISATKQKIRLPASSAGNGQFAPFGKQARKKFINQFGIEPCHPDVLFQTVGRLRHCVFNDGNLRRFLGVFSCRLHEIKKTHPNLRPRTAHFERVISRYAQKPSRYKYKHECTKLDSKFNRLMRKIEKTLPNREKRYLSLIYFALMNDFTEREPISEERLLGLGRKNGTFSTPAFLASLGCHNPEWVMSFFEKSGLSVLGFPEADFPFFEGMYSRLLSILGRGNGFHDIGAIFHNHRLQRVNEWDSKRNILTLWGTAYVALRVKELKGEKTMGLSESQFQIEMARLEQRERAYVFVHELAHAIDDYLLQLEGAHHSRSGHHWKALSWERRSSGKGKIWLPKRHPFLVKEPHFDDLTADELKGGMRCGPSDQIAWQYGFVSYYAATSPGEDFAESVASYLVGDRELLKAVNPDKFLFLRTLFREERLVTP